MTRWMRGLACGLIAGGGFGFAALACSSAAHAGVLPVNVALHAAARANVITVQWGMAWWPREPWDYNWGAPPYYFPYGREAPVIYYPAAPYYYLGFQTAHGYNGHFGRPAAVQYAVPGRAPPRQFRPPLGD